MKINRRLKIGIAILIVFFVSSFVLPLFNKNDPTLQGTYLKNMPVSWQHPLGTNSLGQDIFWYLIYAIRNSLLLGLFVGAFIFVISVLIGLSAGYAGGWYDRLIMLLTDSFITIPAFPILIVLSALLRGRTSFLLVGVILVVFGWAWNARTVRSMALSVREREFVHMAWFSGSSRMEIILKDVFPYVYSYTVVVFINDILYAINMEAALAVIGLSKVDTPTLGSILYWAITYSALLAGNYKWIVAPIVATVILFVGLFLTSTGYNQLFSTRRGQ